MRKAFYISLFFLFLIFVLPVVFVFFAFQSTPAVKTQITSNAIHAKRTREILKELQTIAQRKSGTTQVQVFENELNGMIAVAGRAIPDLRGKSVIKNNDLRVSLSVKVPKIKWMGWLNISGAMSSSPKGVNITAIQVGPFPLPSSLVLPLTEIILDRILGDELGQVSVNSITRVKIFEKRAVFDVTLSSEHRKKLTRRLKSRARSFAGVSNPENVKFYYDALDRAAKNRKVPVLGSFVPYMQYALNLSLQRSNGKKLKQEKQAAILALAVYCGHSKFQQLLSKRVTRYRRRKTSCTRNTLAGRRDLRAHFIISAGLKAASDAGLAFAIGEFKELLDSNRGGSGFSFDDIAADRAGIRFAEEILKADSKQLKNMVNKLSTEKVVFPSIADLPAGLSREQFEQKYSNVKSDAYKKVLNEIEQRLDNLELYRDTNN